MGGTRKKMPMPRACLCVGRRGVGGQTPSQASGGQSRTMLIGQKITMLIAWKRPVHRAAYACMHAPAKYTGPIVFIVYVPCRLRTPSPRPSKLIFPYLLSSLLVSLAAASVC